MSEASSGTESIRQSSTRRFGRAVFWIGVALVAIVTILGAAVLLVTAYAGSGFLITSYGNIAIPLLAIGTVMILVGLVAYCLPEGFSKDGLWVLKTGPYVR
ncbi:MAG: hypothetical protein ACXADS_09030 [Candidatus Thorarchaeota archaeon]